MSEIAPAFAQGAERLSGILRRNDLAFRRYLALFEQSDYQRYLFLSDPNNGKIVGLEGWTK